MVGYATGKHAHGFCDRCGFRCDYHDLKQEVVNGKWVGNHVCPTCWDADHPQYELNKIRIRDPQALERPAPDNALDASRKFFGWNPVGNASTKMAVKIGKVTVSNG